MDQTTVMIFSNKKKKKERKKEGFGKLLFALFDLKLAERFSQWNLPRIPILNSFLSFYIILKK